MCTVVQAVDQLATFGVTVMGAGVLAQHVIHQLVATHPLPAGGPALGFLIQQVACRVEGKVSTLKGLVAYCKRPAGSYYKAIEASFLQQLLKH